MTFLERVANFLRANEGRWIAAIEFESVGGRQAWRTRIAECRTQLGMNISNRCRMVKRQDGTMFKLSEYRYVQQDQGSLFRESA